SEDVLRRVMFPLGNLTKKEVRAIAEEHELVTAKKKDSTGICFIGERDFKEFLSEYLPAQPGEMKTLAGEVKGEHDGLMYYTIGQRQGLGIGGAGEPWFVVGKNLEENVLYVEQGFNNPYLYSDSLIATDVNWINPDRIEPSFTCIDKFRYRQKDSGVRVKSLDYERVHVRFDDLERAVTPGHSVVLYDGEVWLGGGTIDKIMKDSKTL